MRDEREWVPVEVTWDEDLADASDDIEWEEAGWENDPLFDPRPRPVYPPLPPSHARTARAFDAAGREPNVGDRQRGERARPKRQKSDIHLTKRKRKKLRAWEVEEED